MVCGRGAGGCWRNACRGCSCTCRRPGRSTRPPCSRAIAGVASLVARAERGGLANLRLVVDDARLLLRALPDGCVERIFVLFPDPWPKTRHHKRRIVNPATVAEFARLLQVGGEVRLATDDMSYARAMLLALAACPEL